MLERKQLHKMLANETWLFGEEYHLSVNDQSLDELLNKHRGTLTTGMSDAGQDPLDQEKDFPADEVDEKGGVRRYDGSKGIVDLTLSRVILHPDRAERKHLVVELKRPSQKVTPIVTMQIKSYAHAVQADERFHAPDTEWTFWAISNDIHSGVLPDLNQLNRPYGMLQQSPDGKITIWVKKWSEIIESNRARLRLFEKELGYAADRESATQYLRSSHSSHLPDSLIDGVSPQVEVDGG